MLVEIVNVALMWFLGASLASFYGVVATRIPEGRSIVRPASSCDGCKRKLDPIELTPVLGYFSHRGKCKTCSSKVPILFPTTEFAYGCMFVASYLKWGQLFFLAPDFVYFFIISSLLLITIISDLMHRKILLVVILLFAGVGVVSIFTSPSIFAVYRLAESALVTIFLLSIYYLHGKKGIGSGDIMLYSALTLIFGASLMSITLLTSCLLAIVATLPFVVNSDALRNFKIPFAGYTSFVILVFYVLSVFDIVPVIANINEFMSLRDMVESR